MINKNLLSIKQLSIAFLNENQWNNVVRDVSFDLRHNEILGIVGESGSGKSVTSLAVMGLLPTKKASVKGRLHFLNRDMSQFDNKEWEQLRGNEISMIFQEPMSSLNPSLQCGFQVVEVLRQHQHLSKKEARLETLRLFEKVHLPDPTTLFSAYPHQISGGQKQRVMIAMAIACKPKILIADEPTTALDVTVQKEIIKLLKSLQKETQMSIIFISHDLALVSEIADRVQVMYQGEVVESATAQAIFHHPKNEYTKALLNARPSLEERLQKLPTIANYLNKDAKATVISSSTRAQKHKILYDQAPLISVENVSKTYISNMGLFTENREVKAVREVSFDLYEGETLGLVGESGCGKSTLGNIILQLDKASSGTITYRGRNITNLTKKELRQLRRELQIIFQDPFASLNPRMTIGQAIMEPMQVHKIHNTRKARKEEALKLLEKVGLSPNYFNRYPHEFSGGQRQRIGIARTIAVQPKVIICDESVSALDISVQAQVLNLLNELKDDFGFTYIFISHDLAVVKYMADQLVVMQSGIIKEKGEADAIYQNPKSSYTQALIQAIPKGI